MFVATASLVTSGTAIVNSGLIIVVLSTIPIVLVSTLRLLVYEGLACWCLLCGSLRGCARRLLH